MVEGSLAATFEAPQKKANKIFQSPSEGYSSSAVHSEFHDAQRPFKGY